MDSLRVFNRQAGFVVAIAALLIALIVPALASAAQVTERSIALSSSSKDADGVAYTVAFTSVGAAGAAVIEFCANSPIIGESCTAPTGFTAAGAAASSGFAVESGATATEVIVEGTIAAATAIEIPLTNINNPSVTGPLYARIVTYDTAANAAAEYPSLESTDGAVDSGGVAISITDTIGVSGAVLESMTFCVSSEAIDEGCVAAVEGGDNYVLNSPTLKLGETIGSTVALTSSDVSEGNIFTQISTNAAFGAVVNLKSNALGCGGLLRDGNVSNPCDIKPADLANLGITAGQAKFGVKTNTATNAGSNANGEYQPVSTSPYNNSGYAMNWVTGDGTGVTSVFGDPILDTDNAPANNKNMQLTFGASVSNSTPAGLYSADLSLIATGKF